ncbi:MAG TPA: PAS domain-containing protein [Gemmatimonadaceae bacterium]|jgi:PAS domain-containing protein
MNDRTTIRDDLISTFAQQRQMLLKHTADAICGETSMPSQKRDERETKLSAILVSSLEELKVAEEELVERTTALAHLRDELEQRVRGERDLFELAPACLLVTDVYGAVMDANRACVRLLKREDWGLERQPISRFIAPDERRRFRDGLSRVVEAGGVGDWRLVLLRPTDSPVTVSAAINVVSDSKMASGQRLLWSIRVLDESDAAIVA